MHPDHLVVLFRKFNPAIRSFPSPLPRFRVDVGLLEIIGRRDVTELPSQDLSLGPPRRHGGCPDIHIAFRKSLCDDVTQPPVRARFGSFCHLGHTIRSDLGNVTVQLDHRFAQARSRRQPITEKPLLESPSIEGGRRVDGIAPEGPDDVGRLQCGADVFRVTLSGYPGVVLELPAADRLVTILKSNSKVADQNGFSGQLVNLFILRLGKPGLKRRLNGNGVNPWHYFLQHFGDKCIEGEAISKDKMVRIVFPVRLAHHAKILARNDPKKAKIPCLRVIALPGL